MSKLKIPTLARGLKPLHSPKKNIKQELGIEQFNTILVAILVADICFDTMTILTEAPTAEEVKQTIKLLKKEKPQGLTRFMQEC